MQGNIIDFCWYKLYLLNDIFYVCRRNVRGALELRAQIVLGAMSRARKHYHVAIPVRDCAVKYVHPCAAFTIRKNWWNSLCWEMKKMKTPSKFT
jgi:hypothetical protein